MLAASCNSFEPFTFVQRINTYMGIIDNLDGYSYSDPLMTVLSMLARNAHSPAYSE